MAQRPPAQPPYRGGPPPPPRGVPPYRGPAPVPPYGPGPPPPPHRSVGPPPQYLAGGQPQPGGPPPPTRRSFPVTLVLGVVVVVFILLTKPVIITQTLTTPIALLTVLAIAVGVVALKLLLGRLGIPAPAVAVVLGVVWLAMGYFLLWPFYSDSVFPPPVSQAAAPPPVQAPTPGSAPAPTPSGTFSGLEGHRGSGAANLIQVGEGSYVLRLSGVDIGSGPDLRIYLIPGPDQQSPGGDAVELGRFGTGSSGRGDFNYPVPPGAVRAGEPYTVLVWCRPFSVPVAGATLS